VYLYPPTRTSGGGQSDDMYISDPFKTASNNGAEHDPTNNSRDFVTQNLKGLKGSYFIIIH